MISKSMSAIFFILIAYILPLVISGHTEMIFSWPIAVLATAAIILLFTQPALSINEAIADKEKDKSTIYLILIGSLLSQVTATIEWTLNDFPIEIETVSLIGLILVFGGSLFRYWSISTLGKFFTATVKTQKDHQLVTSGPYKLVRHPSYLGAYLAIVGGSLLFKSYIVFLISVFLMWVVYSARIKVEEKALLQVLGDKYRKYMESNKKMIPFVW